MQGKIRASLKHDDIGDEVLIYVLPPLPMSIYQALRMEVEGSCSGIYLGTLARQAACTLSVYDWRHSFSESYRHFCHRQMNCLDGSLVHRSCCALHCEVALLRSKDDGRFLGCTSCKE